NNYMTLLNNPRQPLFNRAVSARYPPGSTFKLLQSAVALQEGVTTPSRRYPCNDGFHYGNRVLKCHHHQSPINMAYATATSCNSYFCYIFRDMLYNDKYDNFRQAYNKWREYVLSFGFGRRLDSDFLSEGSGYLPTVEFYDRIYNGYWNPLSIISLSIGQGELGCTPLQMANMAAIFANRGYYYIPHIIKEVEGRDSLDRRFYERQYTMVDSMHFEPVIKGMWDGVNVSGSSLWAKLNGFDVCGKTGTSQNPHGEDHSTFLSFAPRDNPRIAISVYVENGGFGSVAALPIASLVEEYYLTDTIRRGWLVDYVKNLKIAYPNYEKRD
ncbi:MAG: penicillin-binding transpeptidase domain-containing protein, partial [Rikenellaceae bacterium]